MVGGDAFALGRRDANGRADDETFDCLAVPLAGLCAVVRELLNLFDGVEDNCWRFDEAPFVGECVDDFRRLGSKILRAEIDPMKMESRFLRWVTEDMLFEIIIAKL